MNPASTHSTSRRQGQALGSSLLSEQEFLRRILGNLRTREPDKVAQAEMAIKRRLQQIPSA